MDFTNAIGTEIRDVREVEVDGAPARAVEGARFYSTDAEDLWDALTNEERIPRWFAVVQGELKLGGRYRVVGNAEGSITRCDPPEALDLTWEYGGNISWVSLRLAAEEEGTRLTLVHTMLKDEASEAHWATYGAGATGVGWELAFAGLGLHLESGGQAIAKEANDAWLASEAGKEFMRSSAKSWGEAHIASGEAPEVARAMAERTAKFYTGE